MPARPRGSWSAGSDAHPGGGDFARQRGDGIAAYAERFIRSVGRECLGRVIPVGEGHLRRLLADYEKHYNHERNHQGLENRLIEPLIAANGPGPVRRVSRAAGLLSFYTSEAA